VAVKNKKIRSGLFKQLNISYKTPAMRFHISLITNALILLATNHDGALNMVLCEARSSSSSGRTMSSRRSRSESSSNNSRRLASSSRSSTRKKTPVVLDDYDDVSEDEEDQYDISDVPSDSDDVVSDSQAYDQDIYDDYDDDLYDEFEQVKKPPRHKKPQARSTRRGASSRAAPRSRPSKTASKASRSSRQSRGSSRSSRRVVPYTSNYRRPPSAFSRGLTALRESIPDAQTIKDTAASSISTARQTTTQISSNLYREVKGLRSSELEQVFLKATKPDDSPIKSNFVEQLVAGTYHMSGVQDPWDFALRKLWSKMIESDWRTTLKAVYVLHRFGVDGAPEQQLALKEKLKKMRRTKDPKRKTKYFNTKQILGGYTSPTNADFRAFLSRYAHFVLLRVRCFGGLFSEIGEKPTPTKKSRSSKSRNSSSSSLQKPITSTRLKKEHLDAAKLVLKAGLTCKLKQHEECENTAIAMEIVVADMIGLTSAVAKALISALKSSYDDDDGMMPDKALIQLWCEFYAQDLLPQTKAMMKSTTPTLDAYGLFLPSRIGTTISQELLQKGLKFASQSTENKDTNSVQEENETLVEEGGEEDEGDDVIGYRDDATVAVDREEDIVQTGRHIEVEGVRNYDNVDEYDEYEYDEGYYDTEFD